MCTGWAGGCASVKYTTIKVLFFRALHYCLSNRFGQVKITLEQVKILSICQTGRVCIIGSFNHPHYMHIVEFHGNCTCPTGPVMLKP